jgi:O-antigen/teichoic acid export membrane protein
MVAGLGVQIVATRALGPEQYGLYGLVIANVSLLSSFLSPGISGAMATFVAEREAFKDFRGLIQVVRNGLLIELIVALLTTAIVLLFSKGITSGFFSGSLLLMIAFVILTNLEGFYGLLAGVIQGLRELRGLATIRVLERSSLLVLIVIGLSLDRQSLRGVLAAEVIASSIAILLCWLFLRIYIRRLNFGFQNPSAESNTVDYRSILSFSIPVSVAALSTSLIQNSGPSILTFYLQENVGEKLGIFALLLTSTRMFDRLLKTVLRSAFPYFVRWKAKGEHHKLHGYVIRMLILVSSGYLMIILAAKIGGEPIISVVFGSEYLSAANYLIITLVAFWMASLQDVFRIVLFSLKSTTLFLLINLVGTLLYFIVIVFVRGAWDTVDLISLLIYANIVANITVIIGSIVIYQRYIWSSKIGVSASMEI